MSPKELRKNIGVEDARVVWLFFVPILSDRSVSLSAQVNMKTLILFAGFCGGKLVSYIVTRCTSLVSVHYFLPLAISAKMLINQVASGNWACCWGACILVVNLLM